MPVAHFSEPCIPACQKACAHVCTVLGPSNVNVTSLRTHITSFNATSSANGTGTPDAGTDFPGAGTGLPGTKRPGRGNGTLGNVVEEVD